MKANLTPAKRKREEETLSDAEFFMLDDNSLGEIVAYLDVPSLIKAKRTCLRLRRIVQKEMKRIQNEVTVAENYIFGRAGVEQSISSAVPIVRELCERLVPRAMIFMGLWQLSPVGDVLKDVPRGSALLQTAADMGSGVAFGLCTSRGINQAADRTSALTQLLKQDWNDPLVQTEIGLCYSALREDKLAFTFLLGAAERGAVGAYYHLGMLYQVGTGCTASPSQAVYWYRRGVAQGESDCLNAYGTCLNSGIGVGIGVGKDCADALKCFKLAANQGHMHGLYNCGLYYEKGHSVPVDIPTAIDYYRRAYHAGYQEARSAVERLGGSI